jgi:hypothetical protein
MEPWLSQRLAAEMRKNQKVLVLAPVPSNDWVEVVRQDQHTSQVLKEHVLAVFSCCIVPRSISRLLSHDDLKLPMKNDENVPLGKIFLLGSTPKSDAS